MKRNEMTLPIIVTIIIIAVCLLRACGGSPKKINLNDYLSVSYSGYDNGQGFAEVDIDWDGLSDEFEKKGEFTKETQKSYDEEYSDIKPTSSYYLTEGQCISLQAYMSIGYTAECNGDTSLSYLSNGDKITVHWDVHEDFTNAIKNKIVCPDKTFTVKGLEKE